MIIDAYETDDYLNKAFFFDTEYLLQGNNLVKPDRMGMAVSIENRSPFLDYRMIEFANRIPSYLKIKDGETKFIYKKAVEKLIGQDLTYRKKQMFTVPIKAWISGNMRSYFEELVLPGQRKSDRFINSLFVKERFERHCDEKEDNTRLIRALASLSLWSESFDARLL